MTASRGPATPETWLARARLQVRQGRAIAEVVRAGLERSESELAARPERALAWAQAAARVAASDPASSWLARRAVAKALHAAGRHAEALALIDRLAGDADERQAADLASTRAALLGRLGRTQEALAAASAAKAAFLAIDDPVGAAHAEIHRANVLHRQERHEAALAAYRSARRRLGDGRPRDAGACEVGLGNVLTFLGRPREARAAYQRAERAFADGGHEHLRLVAAYNRHYLDLLDGRAQDALDGLAEVRRGFAAVGDLRGVANCDLDAAEAWLHLHAWPEAADAARAAVAAATDLDMRVEGARARLHLARALSAMGVAGRQVDRLLAQAAAAFRAEGNEVGQATALLLGADAEVRRGRPAEAAMAAREAAASFARHGVKGRQAAALVAEARALLRAEGRDGRRPARARLESALELSRRHPWVRVEASVLLARLAIEDARVEEARRLAGRAMDTLDSLADAVSSDAARSTLVAGFEGAYQAAAAAWLASPRPSPSRAFEAAERSRRFTVAAGRAGRAEALRRFAAAAALEGASNAGALARGLRGAAAAVRAEEGVGTRPRREARLPPLLDLAAVSAHLRTGEILVAHAAADERVAYVVTRDGARLVRLGRMDLREPAARLDAAAERVALFRATVPDVADAAVASFEEHAALVARELLDPFEDDLARCARLLVVPPAELAGVSWAALPWRGRALGATREVVQLPSASWLATRRSRVPRGPTLAIGTSDEAAPLVDREVEAVARVTGGVARAGRWATRGELARHVATASVVHVAGHAVFRADAPALSAIRLADGWVRLADLESLPWKTDLVVLSACRAGAARALGSAQVSGMVRGLLRAGCRSVIASPWSVPDELAVETAEELHAGLAAGAAPAAALRHAQSRLTARWATPHAFAFALFGA